MPKPKDDPKLTHGRHCPCSACEREDWTRITAPCGMHGKDCPAVYAPLARPKDETLDALAERAVGKLREYADNSRAVRMERAEARALLGRLAEAEKERDWEIEVVHKDLEARLAEAEKRLAMYGEEPGRITPVQKVIALQKERDRLKDFMSKRTLDGERTELEVFESSTIDPPPASDVDPDVVDAYRRGWEDATNQQNTPESPTSIRAMLDGE
jgi:hypothetical protein